MLKRKIWDRLQEFKNQNEVKALLVTGARQVGKSFIIDAFARESFAHYARFDLVEQADVRDAINKCKSSEELFLALSAFAGDVLAHSDACVFVDEVQECSEVMTFLKYLVKREGITFILSGSLLEVELGNVRSLPVGYLRVLDMYPLDFEEFCWACGVGKEVFGHVRECFAKTLPVISSVHDRLLDLFHRYLMVGGMPAVVTRFIETNNIAEVKRVQDDIIRLYRADISKYAQIRKLVIREIFDQIPSQLDSQSKRFNFSALASKGTYERYQEDFMWIVDAGVANAVVNVAEPRHPLKMTENRSFFKLFANDVGLLCAMCGMEVFKSIVSDNLGVNYGSIYENAVAQELKAHGHQLRFFRKKGIGELDFVIEVGNGQVLPIEVKSGKSYKRHSALDNVMATENYSIEHAIVLCEANVQEEGRVAYLPSYMVAFL